ncbi:MAG: hypothetical protein GWO02_15805 [Gammaproteobacteria bacterium]|nr:hypothetical protein [Gammaproteobacteria bacterium]
MTALLVCCDTAAAGPSGNELADTLTHYPCAKLSDGAYVINTGEPANVVLEKLQEAFGEKFPLYIIPLRGPWQGRGRNYVQNLLDQWLPVSDAGVEAVVGEGRQPRAPSIDRSESRHKRVGGRS